MSDLMSGGRGTGRLVSEEAGQQVALPGPVRRVPGCLLFRAPAGPRGSSGGEVLYVPDPILLGLPGPQLGGPHEGRPDEKSCRGYVALIGDYSHIGQL
jgi:hypothetical protein